MNKTKFLGEISSTTVLECLYFALNLMSVATAGAIFRSLDLTSSWDLYNAGLFSLAVILLFILNTFFKSLFSAIQTQDSPDYCLPCASIIGIISVGFFTIKDFL